MKSLRPFRAESSQLVTQGVALGYHIAPRWGLVWKGISEMQPHQFGSHSRHLASCSSNVGDAVGDPAAQAPDAAKPEAASDETSEATDESEESADESEDSDEEDELSDDE
jgi:hypothetical protein